MNQVMIKAISFFVKLKLYCSLVGFVSMWASNMFKAWRSKVSSEKYNLCLLMPKSYVNCRILRLGSSVASSTE